MLQESITSLSQESFQVQTPNMITFHPLRVAGNLHLFLQYRFPLWLSLTRNSFRSRCYQAFPAIRLQIWMKNHPANWHCSKKLLLVKMFKLSASTTLPGTIFFFRFLILLRFLYSTYAKMYIFLQFTVTLVLLWSKSLPTYSRIVAVDLQVFMAQLFQTKESHLNDDGADLLLNWPNFSWWWGIGLQMLQAWLVI